VCRRKDDKASYDSTVVAELLLGVIDYPWNWITHSWKTMTWHWNLW